MVEFVIAIVVIGIGSTVLTSFVTPTASSADPMIQARAIATGYVDEIPLSHHDSDPCAGGRGNHVAAVSKPLGPLPAPPC